MNKWYVPNNLNKNFNLAERWLDQMCCLHFDHDESNSRQLNERYGMDYWEALCLIQRCRKRNGLRHTCRCQPEKGVAVKLAKTAKGRELVAV